MCLIELGLICSCSRVNEQRTQNTRGLLRADRKEELEKIGFLWRIKNSETNPVSSIQYPRQQNKRMTESKQVPRQSSAENLPSQSKPPKKRSKKSQDPAAAIVSDSDKDSTSLVRSGSYEMVTPPLAYDPNELDFDLMMSRLQCFRRQYGEEELPPDFSALSLGPWMVAMKTQARAGQLPDDRARRLVDAGIVLINGESQVWLEFFWDLRDYIVRYGHSWVSVLDNPALAAWATAQRRRFRLGKLSEARKASLQKIGFELDGSACTGSESASCQTPKNMSTALNNDMEAFEIEVDLLAAARWWSA
jgi:Helicase associated domain